MAELISRRHALAIAATGLGIGSKPLLAGTSAQSHDELAEPSERRGRSTEKARLDDEAETPEELGAVDEIISRVLEDHRVAGALIAIAKNGRLVLDRGYGVANRRTGQFMTARTIGDIASVTKPITAAAILRLREEGRLDLNARLVDILSDLRPFPGLAIVDPRFLEIKVHHLLYHGGGFGDRWAKSRVYDTEVARLRAFGARTGRYVGSEVAALNYRLAMSSPLKFDPGTEHSYSNFGFVTLRLVVERASWMRYEDYCQIHVLRPMGIHRMRLDTHGPVYFRNETHRYTYHSDTGRYNDAGGGVSAGAAGNWIASTSDLVRFLLAIDGARGEPFFRKDTLALMLGPPPKVFAGDTSRRWPGLGFGVSKSDAGLSYSKNGGVTGASTWIEHLADGNIDWALHMNTTHPSSGHDEAENTGPGPMGVAQRQLKKLFRELNRWPKLDLFDVKFHRT
jgi:N-acyl-D-amino-acid deacylase